MSGDRTVRLADGTTPWTKRPLRPASLNSSSHISKNSNPVFRLLVVGVVWLIGLASMAGYVIIGATMEAPAFRAVFVLVFVSVMTMAMLIFLTIVFFVRRQAT